MENQTKSSTSNKGDQVQLTVPYPMDTCIELLKQGYAVSHLANGINHSEKFHVTQWNKIDNHRMGFRAMYRTQKGKRARSVYLSGVLRPETAQSTRVTARAEFPIHSMGCLAVFFSPPIVLAFFSDFALAAIAVYVIMLIIGYVILSNEYRSTTPESIKALAAILEGKAYGMRTWKQ